MATLAPPPAYDESVFLNCPFDKQYKPLLDAILFCVHDCGFVAHVALQDVGGAVRIAKLLEMIRGSRHSINDLSRVEGTRLNMTFECGLFFGAKEFGDETQKRKDLLILDSKPNRYKKIMSDAGGIDGAAHNSDPERVRKSSRS